ncbi:MAG: transposase [Candidatus Paceibacterota bacterium]|jgi:putative transposase
MDRAPIEEDSFHHVYNRGVDKRVIFEEDKDYKRFLLYLQVLNDTEVQSPNTFEVLSQRAEEDEKKERLADVVAFCLMPNHFHLLLHECREGGISRFMQRLGTAYTMYFNEKNDRSGALFQGPFKSKLVDDEEYLLGVIDYIHLNPREIEHLSEYRWSSYHDFCNQKKYDKILTAEALNDFTELPKDYRRWITGQHDFSAINHITIDHK